MTELTPEQKEIKARLNATPMEPWMRGIAEVILGVWTPEEDAKAFKETTEKLEREYAERYGEPMPPYDTER